MEVRSVLLVGFMGSGKTTVGRRLARRLRWELVDFDERVEEEAGCSIDELFRSRGEPAFRAIEARVASEALKGDRRVLAAGGGWAAAPGRLEGLGPEILSVWLDVTAETAIERVREDPEVRPLLDVEDPVERARELLSAREPYYRLARLHLDTESAGPEQLVERIVRHIETS